VVFTPPALTKTLQHYTEMVLHLDGQIEALDADIEEIAARDRSATWSRSSAACAASARWRRW